MAAVGALAEQSPRGQQIDAPAAPREQHRADGAGQEEATDHEHDEGYRVAGRVDATVAEQRPQESRRDEHAEQSRRGRRQQPHRRSDA